MEDLARPNAIHSNLITPNDSVEDSDVESEEEIKPSDDGISYSNLSVAINPQPVKYAPFVKPVSGTLES